MAERDAVLFANEAFYHAFSHGDVAAMDALWSVAAPVSCIHPGWGAILDREEIMASWSIYGDVAVVICLETMGEGSLIATNIFCREGRLWKIVHHQAGPTSAMPDSPVDEPSAAFH